MALDPRIKAWLLRLYELPFLAVVVVLAFRWRMLPYDAIRDGEHVYFIGTDPYYHWRVILANVANFPSTIRFDPYTHYPFGTGTGQFGSLFDQGAALLAIVLGKTDRTGVAEVTAMYPALLGALLFVPFYFLARRLVGRVGALFATVALLLLPGEFLVRSLAGYADHHVAEALGMVLAILGVFVAIETAAARGDALRLPRRAEDWRALAWPLATVALGALGVVAYFLFWPPAVLVVGIFGVVLAITLTYDHSRGSDTRYLAFGGGGPFLLAGLLLLPTAEVPQFNFNTFSYLQPVSCLILGVLVVVGHYASLALRARHVNRAVLPLGGAASALVGFFSLKALHPALYGSLKWGASWVTGWGVQRETLTIAEAQPSSWSTLEGEYGGILLTIFVVVLFALFAVVLWRRRRGDLLLLVWGLLMYRAASTQVRFNYYLALVVALAFGWVAYQVAEAVGLNRSLDAYFSRRTEGNDVPPSRKGSKGRRAVRTDEPRVRWHQVAAVALVGLLVLPGLVVPAKDANGTSAADCSARIGRDEVRPAYALGRCFGGADPNLVLWIESLEWLRESTPAIGFDVRDVHARPPPGEHPAYPEGSYGILSWWDYGHWIQVEGERPPVANPFQQAAPFASCYFMATSEERADEFLEAWERREFERPRNDVPCRDVPVRQAVGEPAGKVRYVMIDDEMAAGKFGAITVWAKYDGFYDADARKKFRTPQGQEVELNWNGPGYYDTMLARLYVDDAEGLTSYRLVHETKVASLIGSIARVDSTQSRITRFNDLLNRDVREAEDLGYRSGGSLVPTGNGNEFIYDARMAASVKTFERVEGARIVGDGAPANATVEVSILMRSDTSGREWVWSTGTTADENGRFAVTVPYATSEYVSSKAGGTDLTVKATGPALVVAGAAGAPTHGAEIEIPDRAVLDGAELRVTLAQ